MAPDSSIIVCGDHGLIGWIDANEGFICPEDGCPSDQPVRYVAVNVTERAVADRLAAIWPDMFGSQVTTSMGRPWVELVAGAAVDAMTGEQP